MLPDLRSDNGTGSVDSPVNFTVKFQDEAGKTDRICLFSSYSFRGVVEDYVFYYLGELKKCGFSIVFITTSELTDSCVQQLKDYAYLIIERENICPDFGSWKIALSLLDWGHDLEAVLLANDSVFGPFYDLGKIIPAMNKRYDVWGMTDSYEIEYHLQSYFLHANRNVLLSKQWLTFWKNIDLSLSKQAVIDRYEAGLSKILIEASFRVGAYVSINELSKNADENSRLTNTSLRFWKIMIERYDFPFLKREAIIKRDIHKVYWHRGLYINVGTWRKLLAEKSSYPLSNIDSFILKYHEHIKLINKDIKLQKRKILFLAHNVELGGAQFVLLNFLKWLKQETDIPFEVVVCRAGKLQLETEFSTLCVVTHLYNLTDEEKQHYKNRLVDEQIALVFSNTMINIAALQFLSFLDVPQIVYAHELTHVLNAFPLIKSNEDWLRKHITHFITGSNVVRDNLITYLKLEPEKVSVTHEFINDDYDYSDTSQLAGLRKSLNIPDDAFVVGMCGTFEWRKSADLIPVVATSLCRNNLPIHLIWIGSDPESPLYSQIQFDLDKTGLSGQVHLINKQKNYKPYFKLFDLFIMLSREDPFPLVNLESGLAGKPVLCFENSGGTPEYVSFGTGHTVPYLDFMALSEKVNSYFYDRALLESESKIIPQIVKNNFTTKSQAPKLFETICDSYDLNELMFIEEVSVTIMTHIFYDNSWTEIKSKLQYFNNGSNYFLFSISEACISKLEIIADIKANFRNSHTLITSNIGKDIGGKLALIDLYLMLEIHTSYIIFLHDKQSPQTLVGESWKNNLYKIIDPSNLRPIVRAFQSGNIGLVGAKEHIINEYDEKTGSFRHNNDLSKQFLQKFNINITNYDYISGTMYWLKASVIEKFFSQNNPIVSRKNLESGNVLDNYGDTLAHTWERMFCWMVVNEGYLIKGI